MTTTPIRDRHRSRNLNGTPPMAERKEDATAVPPPHLQMPTPTSSVSRWSQSSYSISISGERGFSEDDAGAAGSASTNAPTPASLGPLHNRDDESVNEKRICGLPRDMSLLIGFLILLAIAVAVLLAVSFGKDDSGPSHPNETSTSSHQQSTKSHTSITTGPIDSKSETAVVVQVTTQVIQTTVGTLTVNGSYASTILSTIFDTSASAILSNPQ